MRKDKLSMDSQKIYRNEKFEFFRTWLIKTYQESKNWNALEWRKFCDRMYYDYGFQNFYKKVGYVKTSEKLNSLDHIYTQKMYRKYLYNEKTFNLAKNEPEKFYVYLEKFCQVCGVTSKLNRQISSYRRKHQLYKGGMREYKNILKNLGYEFISI